MARQPRKGRRRIRTQRLTPWTGKSDDGSARLDIGFRFPGSPGNGKVLLLPFRRSWPIIIVSGVFLSVFCIPYVVMGQQLQFGGIDDLSSLVSLLFTLFWLGGWSIGVVLLALVFLLTLLGRESLQIQPGSVTLRLELGVIGFGARYQAAAITNLQQEPAQTGSGHAWRGEHLAFDWNGKTIRFGSAINPVRAQQILSDIQTLGIDPAPQMNLNQTREETRPATPDTTTQLKSQVPEATTALSTSLEAPGISSLSTLALIAANLIPLGGVLLLDWQIGDVMLLFWAESAIIGVYNLFKMWVIGRWSVLIMGPFFIGHYGAFMAVHLLLIYGLFQGNPDGADPELVEVWSDFTGLWPALLGLVVSHGVSFSQNFLGRGEFRYKSVRDQMGEPYKRIIVMHMTIIFGGFLVMAFNAPIMALGLLIILKIVVDTGAHIREHSQQAHKAVSRHTTVS